MKTLKLFFSNIKYRLLSLLGKKPPPVEERDFSRLEECTTAATLPGPASPQAEPEAEAAPPVTPKRKKPPLKPKKKKPKPRYDSKGFRILSNRDNLGKLFDAGKYDPHKREPVENFAEMFEKSQTDSHQQYLLNEKKQTPPTAEIKPLSISERLKDYPPPQIQLDLHGYTKEDAQMAVRMFIDNAAKKNIRSLRLIVGKGLHSQGKAVLPDAVERLLFQMKREKIVLTFQWEKKDKRKSGSVSVYLV